MITVSLNDLKFKAYHGIHEEEKILGNDYIVNCSVQLPVETSVVQHLHETIDYKEFFDLIKKQMSIPTPLLETLCMKTGNLIHETFPKIKSVSISVQKLHPPIKGFVGSSTVRWDKEY